MPAVGSWFAAAVVAVVLTGCGDDPAPVTREEPSVEDSDPASSAAPPPGSDATVVRQAVADLAGTLGVDPVEVAVVAVEEVTWRNGSRGCARPDVMYTQALIDGSRITLRVDEVTYEYHSGGSGPPSLCEKPTQ